jgi:hypothetical protein
MQNEGSWFSSRGAAEECSPRRKPWVISQNEPSRGAAKEHSARPPSPRPVQRSERNRQHDHLDQYPRPQHLHTRRLPQIEAAHPTNQQIPNRRVEQNPKRHSPKTTTIPPRAGVRKDSETHAPRSHYPDGATRSQEIHPQRSTPHSDTSALSLLLIAQPDCQTNATLETRRP